MELIIVIVVMAMMTAVVMPQFSTGANALAFQQAQSSIVGSLRYAQMRAIAQRQRIALAVTSGQNAAGYQLSIFNVNANEWQALNGRFGRSKALPRGASLHVMLPDGRARVPESVTFYPDGRADAAQLVLKTAQGNTATIDVDEATGHITVLSRAQ